MYFVGDNRGRDVWQYYSSAVAVLAEGLGMYGMLSPHVAFESITMKIENDI